MWSNQSRLQGNKEANLELGRCYQRGIGVEQDFRKAFKLFKKAYKFGGFGGSYDAHCYEEGVGVE